ncbi:hypothetical protein DYU11_16185 [Fibrisoma montanum]|uniref:DUF4369 domain-containing protein n=1 Tax=Fibrisoma montanum TaxID=2305895 RepID=A0A418M8Y2_9BACT|nr:hypothetical protein [Fibrisoma montanum]RIV22552.1 hypothetical protein DYU11_16185 [Fibrisoma montanum]
MKAYVLLIVLWLSAVGVGTSHAKGAPNWNLGQLLLTNGTQIEGELNYNWKAEIVQVRQGNTIKAYSATQVDHFVFFDANQNTLRRFVAVEYPVRQSLMRKLFLEEFVPGTLTVYRRLRHTREPIKVISPIAYGDDEELVKDLDSFTYFVYDENGIITNLDNFTRDIWPRLKEEYGEELKHFVDGQSLDLGTTLSQLLLINQYNALKKQQEESGEPVNQKVPAGE